MIADGLDPHPFGRFGRSSPVSKSGASRAEGEANGGPGLKEAHSDLKRAGAPDIRGFPEVQAFRPITASNIIPTSTP
jgi:hypothetical protein